MGGSAKTQQNSTSTYTPTAQASGLYTNIINQAQAAQSGYNPATAQTVAGLNGTQNQAFGNIAGNQGIWQPNVSAGANMVQGAGQGISAADISQFYNPFQNDVTNATMQQANQQDAMQNRAYTANEASQSGLGGNGFYVGKAQLAGQQNQNNKNTLASLNSAGFAQALAAAQADKTRGLSAGQSLANIGGQQAQLAGNDASQLLASGNQQQAQQQNVNNTASQNALNEQLFPMQQAQWLAGIGAGIGPLTGGTTTGSGQAQQSQGKGAGNVLGAGLSLASMMSDERAKEDINHVGETHDGQPIYSFRYKGDPRTQMGLMAQDVERGNHPEAVSEAPGGMKMVNYDAALRDNKADGGMALPPGLMGWSQINPANVRPPELPNVSAPAQQQGMSPEQYDKMGKDAGKGLGNLQKLFEGSKLPSPSSPAGGALAASGMQESGGLGGLSGLASLFGFADGGTVDDTEEDPYRTQALRLLPRVIQQESGGDPNVVSEKGARGTMQVMPETGRQPGYGVTPLRDDSDTENRRFGTDYLTAMLRKYGGDEQAALIGYNGGPARADNWLSHGRDDASVPAESANYYKSILGAPGAALVAKAKEPAANGAGMGEPYQGKADKASGGLLKRVFGVDFNPLNLSENERKALFVAGMSMMANGNVGQGGLAGMQYLSGAEAGERDRTTEAGKLAYQMKKDAADLALRTRAETRMEGHETREGQQFNRSETRQEGAEKRAGDQFATTSKLEADKFGHTKSQDQAKLDWEKTKLDIETGKATNDQKEYAQYVQQETAAGRTPLGILDYQKDLKAAGRPQTNVTVSGEKKGAEEMAKGYAKMYTGLRDNAEGARTLADNLSHVEQAISTGVPTGALGDMTQQARKIGRALGVPGIDDKKLAAGEVIQAVTNKLALAVRAPGGESGGMPGAMSDADRSFLQQTVPGLLKTPEGNKQIINIMRAASARHEAIFDMAIDYAEAHDGQLGPGFDRQVRDYVKSNPLSAAVAAPVAAQDKPTPVKTTTVPGVRTYDPSTGAFH